MMSPLSRSDRHSAVQPPVKALGNHASTTVVPLRPANVYVLPSEPGSEKSGAWSPTFSVGVGCGCWAAVTAARARHATDIQSHCFMILDSSGKECIKGRLEVGKAGRLEARK